MKQSWLGAEVWERRRKLEGVVIRETKNPLVKIVRCWNSDLGRYGEYRMNTSFLEVVWHNDENMIRTNIEDPNFWIYYEPAALEVALMSDDPEWFQEIREACSFLDNF